MTTYRIYEITDDTKDWFYVGCTKNSLAKRLGQHRCGKSLGSLRTLYPSIDRDKMEIRLIKEVKCKTRSQAHKIEEEITWEYYNKYGNRLLNNTFGDVHISHPESEFIKSLKTPVEEEELVTYDENGRKHMSEKTRKRMSKAMKAYCATVDRSGPNSPMYGRKMTEEQRMKCALAHTNPPPEVRAKMSAAAKLRTGEKNSFYGKKHSEETKRKLREALSGENSPWWGRKHREESKKKISEAMMGHSVSEEARRKMSINHPDVSGEKNPMYGKRGKDAPWWGRKHTPEELEKMREGRRRFEQRKKLEKHLAEHNGQLCIIFT